MTSTTPGSGRNLRRLLLGIGVLAFLTGGWYAWNWYRTPVPPRVPLEGINAATVAVIENATRQVREQPRSGEAWGQLGLAMIATGYHDQALECLVHARRLDPKNARWAFWQGKTLLFTKPRQALDYLREALDLTIDREERATILFMLALALVEADGVEEAETHLRALGELAPDGAAFHFGMGLLAIARDDHRAARNHLSRLTDNPHARRRACTLLAAVAENPEQTRSYRDRAVTLPGDTDWPYAFNADLVPYTVSLSPPIEVFRELESQGRAAEALEYLRSVAEHSPDEGIYTTLGTTLLERNDFIGATDAFQKVIRLNHRNAKAHLFLASALLQRGQTNGDRGEDFFRQALESANAALLLQGDLPYAHLVRGQALKQLSRRDEALAAFRAALLRGPEFAEIHQALGETLAESGQVEEGLRHLEDAVRLARPNNPRPRKTLEAWREKQKKDM